LNSLKNFHELLDLVDLILDHCMFVGWFIFWWSEGFRLCPNEARASPEPIQQNLVIYEESDYARE